MLEKHGQSHLGWEAKVQAAYNRIRSNGCLGHSQGVAGCGVCAHFWAILMSSQSYSRWLVCYSKNIPALRIIS